MKTYNDYNFFEVIERRFLKGGSGKLLNSAIYYLFNSHVTRDEKGKFKNQKIIVIIPKKSNFKGGILHLNKQRPVILKEIDKKEIKENIISQSESQTPPALCEYCNIKRSFLRGFDDNDTKKPIQLSKLLNALHKIVFKEESK